jgi:TetR/AcrR family transcriptional repressor of bet genes
MPGRKASEDNRREDILRAAYDVAARHGVEALTLRAVAARATVSHGTVLFYFKRRHELVVSLLDRVLDATAVLRLPKAAERLTHPAERMEALLRAEMERLSGEPRHFRLFLEYWALGVRSAAIRRKVSAALDGYRAAFRTLADEAVAEEQRELYARSTRHPRATPRATPEGLAAVAVSVVHGCALQAVIDPKGFSVQQHFAAAAALLERLAPPQLASA